MEEKDKEKVEKENNNIILEKCGKEEVVMTKAFKEKEKCILCFKEEGGPGRKR